MRRLALPLLLAASAAGCVSVAQLPDPRGALKPGQRLVVLVYQSPGPWIVGGADTKAEAAAKISPLGVLVQGVEDEHTLSVSKNLQQYLPRPPYWEEVQAPLLKALKVAVSSAAVQTGIEAGIAPPQLFAWNKAKDQLDWRYRYYAPDPSLPPPRDYARALVLDDALILDVNLSFGTEAVGVGDQSHIAPALTAASRVYRGDTSRLVWEHEDEAVDAASTATVVDFELQPSRLTDDLQKLAPQLGQAIAASFLKAFGLAVAPPPPAAPAGGLVPMSMFEKSPSSGTPSGFVPRNPPQPSAYPGGVVPH
ncbi:MAG: hypothetical protein KGM24_04110 [Elusimicrobia bacterium]|nr:hypothetical protein [Elusimicrobiota bacterium]